MSSRASHSASSSAISPLPGTMGAATPPAAMTVCTARVWAAALSTWIPATWRRLAPRLTRPEAPRVTSPARRR